MDKELEQAVQTVDFERAEQVSDGLVSVERDREKLLVVGREAEADCDAVEVKMHEALEMQIVAKEECAGLLKSFAVIMEASCRDLIANPTITMDHLDSQMMKVSNLCNHGDLSANFIYPLNSRIMFKELAQNVKVKSHYDVRKSLLMLEELAEDDVSWNDEEAISWFKFEVHAARKYAYFLERKLHNEFGEAFIRGSMIHLFSF